MPSILNTWANGCGIKAGRPQSGQGTLRGFHSECPRLKII